MASFYLTIIEITIKNFKDAFREIQQERNDVELSFSGCPISRVREYLARFKVGYEVGDTSVLRATDLAFAPFQWLTDEEKDTQRAKEHLQDQLSQFGVRFGKGQYDLYDVHNKTGILSLDDKKTGILKGGTDLILAPYGLHVLGLTRQLCVAVELKTNEDVVKNGFSSFIGQATLQLIAANYFSNQMTVVVLTDLFSGATIFTLNCEEGKQMNVVIYEDVELEQAANFIADHLTEACVPIKNHSLDSGRKSADDILRTFKKARVSALEDSVVWEQFQEMLQDCPPGTRDRAEIINQLYRACDFPEPAFLSMFV